jgi:hypothetical protein
LGFFFFALEGIFCSRLVKQTPRDKFELRYPKLPQVSTIADRCWRRPQNVRPRELLRQSELGDR